MKLPHQPKSCIVGRSLTGSRTPHSATTWVRVSAERSKSLLVNRLNYPSSCHTPKRCQPSIYHTQLPLVLSCRLTLIPSIKIHEMVRSMKILSVAAAVMMSAASGFTPTASNSYGTISRPLSPPPLQAAVSASVLDGPSTPVLDRPSTIERQSQDKSKSTDREMHPNGDWILRIYNDNINTREYVAVCLVQVVGLCESRAYYTMQDAHHNGIAKVGEYNQEVAECYEEQLIDRGVMCDVVSADGE
mmetsp:Transcript_13748/g.29539  ORF Transcript_13748/g.29539 Transcript_13748/m.29539 type:complete len:245 (+) Transcript_13748:1-735(+)